jgi:hypothetical protein
MVVGALACLSLRASGVAVQSEIGGARPRALFEPVIAVHTDSGRPYLGTGLARVERAKGFLRIVFH